VDLVVSEMLPEIKRQDLATAVDVFCEKIAFSRDQAQKIFKAAGSMGFNIKLHAEQLSDTKGTSLACEFNALSCDHLEYLSEAGVIKMANNSVTAVLLPGAFYFLKETRLPPVELFRAHNVPMALSTDLNPGSSPIHSMSVIMNMGCILFGLTVEESASGGDHPCGQSTRS
jgi:imidazolonepropionase